jgi:hypothetical protein
MSYNLVVWKWSAAYDSAAKRRKLGLKVGDILAAFARDDAHPGMAPHDFTAFEEAVRAEIGPEKTDGPYILDRSACARTYNMPFSQEAALVPVIHRLARAHGLTTAEL